MLNLGPISLNFVTTLVVLAGLLVLAWSLQAFQNADSASEAGREVGDKVQRSVGGTIGFVSALIVGVVVGLYDAGMEFADVLGAIGDIVVSSPQSAMGVATAAVGSLGISGTIHITTWTYVGVAIVLLGTGIALANRKGAQS